MGKALRAKAPRPVECRGNNEPLSLRLSGMVQRLGLLSSTPPDVVIWGWSRFEMRYVPHMMSRENAIKGGSSVVRQFIASVGSRSNGCVPYSNRSDDQPEPASRTGLTEDDMAIDKFQRRWLTLHHSPPGRQISRVRAYAHFVDDSIEGHTHGDRGLSQGIAGALCLYLIFAVLELAGQVL